MNTEWKSPKIIIGPVATDDYYFRRRETEQEILNELDKGNFVLLAAPRRVGKTSIMKFIASQQRENFLMLFKNVQGIQSEAELYKALFGLVLSCLKRSTRLKTNLFNFLKSKTITEVDVTGGFKIETEQINYLEAFNQLIVELDSLTSETIVLLIDEIPELLHTLNKNGKKSEASSILKNLRQWRQNQSYNKVRFVLAGSIGIHYVVNAIEGRTADLNDLRIINCPPLDSDEINAYIEWATQNATIQYDATIKAHLLSKVQYFVPYFMNLIFDEIDRTSRKTRNSTITISDIDKAFEMVAKQNSHFADWIKRLMDYMTKEDFTFVNDILTHIAHNDRITVQELYNKAVKYDKTTDYMDFINGLVQDGYIIAIEHSYQFLSPFLRTFWKNNNPVYHG